VCVKVVVSARSEQQDDPERRQFPTIVDSYDDMGPVAGILSAMDEHPEADWLVVACDLPNIDAATLGYLIRHRSDARPFTAYKSSYDGLPEPLCAIYSAGSDKLIRAFVDDGLLCPRKMLINSDTELLVQPNPDALDNINTPGDLEASVLGSTR
jgi:molybdopterin-guanine dinucleotide biosynthesis protein A